MRRWLIGLVFLAGCLPNAREDRDALLAVDDEHHAPKKVRLLAERIQRDMQRMAADLERREPTTRPLEGSAYVLVEPRERVILYSLGEGNDARWKVTVGASEGSLKKAVSAVALISVSDGESVGRLNNGWELPTWYLWRDGMWIDQGRISTEDGMSRGIDAYLRKSQGELPTTRPSTRPTTLPGR